MGNTHGKESRGDPRRPGGGILDAGSSSAAAGHHGDLADRSGRQGRPDLSPLHLLSSGSGSGSRGPLSPDAPFERKETRQEREARRREREQAARIKERERSMKEEHVDGGFLVTMGIYTALEDFSKPTVRQLIIERRLAPFWRGLEDFDTTWAEHQIIAAARGLEIPPADEVPENLVPQPRSIDSPSTSLQNLNSLTVPMGPRTLSAASDKTGSNPGSALPSPTSPAPPRLGSSFKPHKKAIAAALSISSRNNSQQDIATREITLPQDPFVNGQPLEVFLYKDGLECPVCFMYYPRYLNKTRCCDQSICSECFVQIKRPDPHLPEHVVEQQSQTAAGTGSGDLESPAPPPNTDDQPTAEFVMEPACCPYCTQTEFGIAYEPPPFRRGLTYQFAPPALGTMGTAMSSTSSLNSNLSPTSATTPGLASRRRTQSLSATAPGVITSDRIRPDWTTKLTNARQQQRRRAAAADALHHAAFVIGNSETTRTLFGRSGRFSRRNTGSHSRGTESPVSGPGPTRSGAAEGGADSPTTMEPGPRISSGPRTGPTRERIDAAHLESLMMAEAIRLSLADEEDRRKKAEKEAKKEAKKKDKEDRKANKRRGSVYGGSDGASSASASSLSLGLGRRRGNSAAGSASQLSQSLRVAATTASANQSSEALAPTSPPGPSATDGAADKDKGKAVDRGDGNALDVAPSASFTASVPIPTGQPPRGSSHLRQMSNASSVSSSGIDSAAGSYDNRNLHTEDPRASALSLGGSGNRSEEEGAGTESMFNFRSLAQMVGVPIDGEEVPTTAGSDDALHGEKAKAAAEEHEHIEHASSVQSTPVTATNATASPGSTTISDPGTSTTAATSPAEGDAVSTPSMPQTVSEKQMKANEGSSSQTTINSSDTLSPQTPTVTITPETPAPLSPGAEEFKQLGHAEGMERVSQVTQ